MNLPLTAIPVNSNTNHLHLLQLQRRRSGLLTQEPRDGRDPMASLWRDPMTSLWGGARCSTSVGIVGTGRWSWQHKCQHPSNYPLCQKRLMPQSRGCKVVHTDAGGAPRACSLRPRKFRAPGHRRQGVCLARAWVPAGASLLEIRQPHQHCRASMMMDALVCYSEYIAIHSTIQPKYYDTGTLDQMALARFGEVRGSLCPRFGLLQRAPHRFNHMMLSRVL